MTTIPAPVLKRIRGRAVEAYPEECCGFLVGRLEPVRESVETVRVFEDRAAENVAPAEDRLRKFVIEPRALLDITKELRNGDEELVGFYHSHPNHPAELSPTDMEFARLWPETMWLIVPVEGGAAGPERAWWLPARGADAAPHELTIREVKIRSETALEADAANAAPPRGIRAHTPRGDTA